MLNERRETFQAAGKLNFINCRTLDTFIKYDIEHCIQYTFYIVTGSRYYSAMTLKRIPTMEISNIYVNKGAGVQ